MEVGCGKSPQTTSQIFNAAATSVGQVIQEVDPGWKDLPTYKNLVKEATPLIAEGLTGTNGQKALQIVSEIVTLVESVPNIPSQYQVIMSIGVAGFTTVLALLQKAQGAQVTEKVQYHSVQAYQKAWNSEIGKHAELSKAKLAIQ